MQSIEAFQLILADLIEKVGLVISFSAFAQILGEDPQTLRVRECRARAKGIELFPPPLMLQGKERQWSAPAIARWLCDSAATTDTDARPGTATLSVKRGRGRPRKAHSQQRGAAA